MSINNDSADYSARLASYIEAPMVQTKPALRYLAMEAIRLARLVNHTDRGRAINLACDALYFRQLARKLS